MRLKPTEKKFKEIDEPLVLRGCTSLEVDLKDHSTTRIFDQWGRLIVVKHIYLELEFEIKYFF